MFCKKCGKEMKEDWKICPSCGSAVEEEKTTVVPELENVRKPKKPILKKWWFWVLVALSAIIIIPFLGGEDTVENVETETKSVEQTVTEESNKSITEYTSLELFEALEDNEEVPYTISEKASNFLKEHDTVFPTTNYAEIAGLIDTSIEYKHISKNASQYGDKMMELSDLYVMSINEEDLGDGIVFSTVETVDEYGDYYYLLYKGELANVFQEDYIKGVGLPFSISSYDNVSGGTTLSLVLAGSYIEKLE